jgi:hypothetical protein
MGSRNLLPAEPATSPFAEAVTTFEASYPDAVALLLPFTKDLTPGEIEARARKKFPTRPSDQRAEVIAQAMDIRELILAETVAREGATPGTATAPEVSIEAREQRWSILAAAIETNPSMTMARGIELVTAEAELDVAPSTFYNAYWRVALDRVPPHIRELRRAMTDHRPGSGKLPRTAGDRVQVLHAVSVIKRDHPGWHRGQIMDEVRRVTRFQFRDPIAFERHYITKTEPAPPDQPEENRAPRPHGVLREPMLPSLAQVPGRESLIPAESGVGQAEKPGEHNLLLALISVVDPLRPADLRPADEGRFQFCLNLGPTEVARSYQLMSLLYAEMARLAAGPGR